MAQFDLNRAQDTPIPTLKLNEITPEVWPTLPPPVANMDRANAAEEAKPRTSAPGAAEDWNGGETGNDIDANFRAQPIGEMPPSGPPPWISQYDKATVLGVGYAADIGIDYGEFSGQTGRAGTITPLDPYPVAAPEPEPEPEPEP